MQVHKEIQCSETQNHCSYKAEKSSLREKAPCQLGYLYLRAMEIIFVIGREEGQHFPQCSTQEEKDTEGVVKIHE